MQNDFSWKGHIKAYDWCSASLGSGDDILNFYLSVTVLYAHAALGHVIMSPDYVSINDSSMI